MDILEMKNIEINNSVMYKTVVDTEEENENSEVN